MPSAAKKTVVSTEETAKTTATKPLTPWGIFTQLGLLPAQVRCDGYKAQHPSDQSCHSNLTPTAENVVRHTDPRHGGGWFTVRFNISDTKRAKLWNALEAEGVEIKELWCPHCREDVEISPKRILYHLNPHQGAMIRNMFPLTLCLTLGQAEVESFQAPVDY